MSLCERPDPHTPHFFRRGDWPKLMDMESCPGIDSPTVLAPEQDRPVTEDTPDWTPETLYLTDAAAIVVRAYQTGKGDRPSPSYYGAIMVWRELTGMDEAAALTYAYQIATVQSPVTAVVPPF